MGGTDERAITVWVDDVHLTYKVGRRVKLGAAGALARTLGKTPKVQREVKAVQGVSLTARQGDSIGLIGRNGSGKSTLLRAIAGLLTPRSGQVYTSGQPSLLGVGAAMMNDLSGERNVVLGCLAMGMSRAEIRERYSGIVEFSGLGGSIDLPLGTYSSGMSARLKFAIASARVHEVLLIDEALSTGDAEFRQRSEKKIRELRDQAGTVFLVSHNLKVVRDTCTRGIWLDGGRVVLDGPVEEVVAEYEAQWDPRRRSD